jgi:pyruvate-formate lyase-activating enzyme
MTPDGAAAVELTPFIGPLEAEARAGLAASIRGWLEAPTALVELHRSVSARSEGPTHVIVREGAAALGFYLRLATGSAWQAGPLGITVEREVEGTPPTAHPASRAWLARLARWFATTPDDARAAHGTALATLHHRWATLQWIHDRDYRHIEFAHTGPTAFLRPSFRCNQDCHFCWEGRDWPEPPEELVSTWMDELAATGAARLTFCGGEPTLNRRLPELIEQATRHGMRVHIDTNAIKLKNRDYATRLHAAGLRSALVSFHSADPTVSDAMTRAPGTWKRTVEGIHGALDAGLDVVLNCVVERANVDGLAAHAAFIRDEFVLAHADNPVRMVNYSQPGMYYERETFFDQMVPIDVARPHVAAAARILDAVGVMLEITGTCGFPSCVAHDIPALVPWRPARTVDKRHASARAHEPAVCAGCAARGHCIGVRHEYVARWLDRGLIPFEVLPESDWYERARAGLGDGWVG